jgi:hypothetical protein
MPMAWVRQAAHIGQKQLDRLSCSFLTPLASKRARRHFPRIVSVGGGRGDKVGRGHTL